MMMVPEARGARGSIMGATTAAPLLGDDVDVKAALALSDDEAAAAVGRARERLDGAHRRLRSMTGAPVETFDFWHKQAFQLAIGNSDREQLIVYLRAAKRFEAMATDPSQWPKTAVTDQQALAAPMLGNTSDPSKA
jgi:hypothetical protein